MAAANRKVAVIVHAGKTFGDGPLELRRELERRGVGEPLWYEIPKSKHAPSRVAEALEEGAKLIFVWGGDGTVQRCLDKTAGSDTALSIVPAGTANLLAANLGFPSGLDVKGAVDIGLDGKRRRIDIGRLGGEPFAVMAGVGFDALMLRGAEGTLKDRLGRVAYVWSGSQSLRAKPFAAKIAVDGVSWYAGQATCILVGNMGRLFGGIEVFEDARPDDGRLEIGVVSADSVADWLRTIARTAVGRPDTSPFVELTNAHRIDVQLDRKVRYEVDGGDRSKVRAFKVRTEPRAVTMCVPPAS
jgi:diacylglycerol kinase (ATP)